MPELLYKIFTAAEWQAFAETGVFAGSADDRRDGFIHLSTQAQLAGTREKHFARMHGLVIAAVALGETAALKWEESRGGALFPHLYRALGREEVASFQVER